MLADIDKTLINKFFITSIGKKKKKMIEIRQMVVGTVENILAFIHILLQFATFVM